MLSFLNLLFPKTCAGCGTLGIYLCQNCTSSLLQTDLVCPSCEKMAIGGVVHPICKRRYSLDGLWSLGVYQGLLKKTIQKLKYRFVFDLATTLVDILIGYWAKYPPQLIEEIKKDGAGSWVVVPVPLHPTRQKWRGYNQSDLLGKILSKKIGLDYSDCLKRVRNTKSQVGLKGSERKQNIKNAFSLNTKYLSPSTNILLVDDVWTTGSTLRECCCVLKKGGAKNVWALTLAR